MLSVKLGIFSIRKCMLFQNCYGELKLIQEFLQLDVTDSLLREITDNCSLNKMRESKAKQPAGKGSIPLNDISKPGFNMLRKGMFCAFVCMYGVLRRL